MIFETQRCLIRRFKERDIDEFMTYRNNKDWMKYQGFKGRTKQEYREALLSAGAPEDGLQLAVLDRALDMLIGDLYLKREGNACWVGYTISPARARQGYAFEAVSELIAWLNAQGIQKILAAVLPENLPSVRLLKKLGFAFAGQADEGEDLYVLEFTQ